MRVERNNVFETNSSAVHSLAISEDGLEESRLPVDEEGYILADFGDFGDHDMGIIAYDQQTKMSYVLTELYYLNGYDEYFLDDYQFDAFEENICKYTGANGIHVLNKIDPKINHQEAPEYEPKFCNCYDYNSVIQFIFNKFVGIKFSHD